MTFSSFFSSLLQLILLSLVPGLPMLVAIGLAFTGMRRFCLKLAPWTALPALITALLVQPGIKLHVPWFFMGGHIGLDVTGQHFLLFSSLIWFLSALFGSSYLSDDKNKHKFFFYYLLSMSGNFGLILAQDLLSFYLFFAVMSFTAYGLIIHNKSHEAKRAGRIYIILVMLGEVLIFTGILILAECIPDMQLCDIGTSSPNALCLAMLFIGFGIKAGALPLHFWLPLAHPAAPVPASAVLSGVMINAGLLGWIRLLPIGSHMPLPGWGGLFLAAGLIAAFYGVIIGLGQKNPKTVLAYSSISQMGLMTMIVGCGLIIPGRWKLAVSAVSLYAVHHGLAKATLFLGVGISKRVSGPGGIPKWLLAALLLPSLSLTGLPFTSGAIAKLHLKEIVHILPTHLVSLLNWLLPLTAMGTAVLLVHFLQLLTRPATAKNDTLQLGQWIPWVALLASGTILLWIWPQRPSADSHIFFPATIWHGLWPVCTALLAGYFLLIKHPDQLHYAVPTGDILLLFCWCGQRLQEFFSVFSKTAASLLPASPMQLLPPLTTVTRNTLKGENILKRWSIVGFCFLSLCLTLFLLLHAS